MTAAAVWPVDRAPAVLVGESARQAPERMAEIGAARERFRRTGRFSDGPVLMVRAASAERIDAFPATFAWHVVDRVAPLVGTVGVLGVQLAVTTPAGMLWQRRGDAVDAPGWWSISVGGAVPPGVRLEDQVLTEAAEELGLAAGDLLELAPLAVVVSAARRLVEVVYTARLRPGSTARPDGVEVVEVRAAADPSELPGDLDPLTRCWSGRLLALLAARSPEVTG
jgi:ADP-ribose pyrophosphatase YjhB (NUDIX family)